MNYTILIYGIAAGFAARDDPYAERREAYWSARLPYAQALLQAVPAEALRDYQFYWALVAHLLARLRRHDEADAARAIGLCEDPAIRTFLRQQVRRPHGVPARKTSPARSD